jgi:DNA polymerase
MQLLTIDFETTYSKTYSLSKMTTEAYVNDPQFEVVGVAVKINEEPTQWFTGNMMETAQWLAQFDWGNSIVVAHNALFDGAILGWRFNIHPKVIVCTLCMARALHAVSVGGSLAAMSEYYGLGKKGTEVHDAIGKRRADFSQSEIEAYGGYCVNDVELTYKLFQAMLPNVNKAELKLIDITIRMYTNPMLKLDREVLDLHLIDVREQKDKLLEECGIVKEDLMSNNKLAVVLESLGVEVPMKLNSKGAQAFAFAKTDEGFKALAEHDDLRVQAIVAARLGTKSTLEETRTERFIAIAERPNRKSFLPVPLLYYGARTGRWAATDKINLNAV